MRVVLIVFLLLFTAGVQIPVLLFDGFSNAEASMHTQTVEYKQGGTGYSPS